MSLPKPAEAPSVFDLAVVIPAFNEEGAIRQTIAEVQEALSGAGVSFEIVVVDDGSTDLTREEARKCGATVVASRKNSGYGAALKKGIAASNSEYIAILDADGTYPARYLPEMLETARSSDMVVGARDPGMTNVPVVRRPAKLILNWFANTLSRTRIPDLNSGLRVFRRSALVRFVPLLPSGFSFTTTITLCMISEGLNVEYIPIEYRRRIGKSSMRPIEFFNFLILVLRAIVLFSPLRVFLPLGAVLFGMGVVKLAYDIVIGNLSESAVLGILGAIMIWAFGLIADMIARLHLRQ
jgi:glycosyltransferase involved in cell wall biosynthesis